MKSFNLVVLFAASVCACNQSVVPIDTLANAPADSAIVGVWESLDGDSTIVSVFEFRAPEYYVEINTVEGTSPLNWDDPILRARAFITRLDGENFVNIDGLDGKPRGYALYRFELHGDTLIAVELAEEVHKFTTSRELQAHLHSHLRDPAIYKDTIRLRRVIPPAETESSAHFPG